MNVVDIREKLNKHKIDHAYGLAAFLLLQELVVSLDEAGIPPSAEIDRVIDKILTTAKDTAADCRSSEDEDNAELLDHVVGLIESLGSRVKRARGRIAETVSIIPEEDRKPS